MIAVTETLFWPLKRGEANPQTEEFTTVLFDGLPLKAIWGNFALFKKGFQDRIANSLEE